MPNSVHSHFGTCHIGTSTILDCTTALFQVNCEQAVRTESWSKRQFGSNSLLFTPFLTVYGDSRLLVNETASLSNIIRQLRPSPSQQLSASEPNLRIVLRLLLHQAFGMYSQAHFNHLNVYLHSVTSQSIIFSKLHFLP